MCFVTSSIVVLSNVNSSQGFTVVKKMKKKLALDKK